MFEVVSNGCKLLGISHFALRSPRFADRAPSPFAADTTFSIRSRGSRCDEPLNDRWTFRCRWGNVPSLQESARLLTRCEPSASIE